MFYYLWLKSRQNLNPLHPEYSTAILASIKASELIMDYYTKGFDTEIKSDGSPVTQADLASSKLIEELLSSSLYPITGEESEKTAYHIRKNWSDSWCIDPLDGTKEFVKRNGEFAVNIAHIQNGQSVFGIIASPVNEEIIFGGKETGVYISSFSQFGNPSYWQKIERPTTINSPLIVAGSRSHHSGAIVQFIDDLRKEHKEIDFLKKGSSLKFFDLAKGNADAYPRFAPTMEWDIAAGQAILEALGGSVVHADTKEALVYNKENLMNPYFIAKTNALLAKES